MAVETTTIEVDGLRFTADRGSGADGGGELVLFLHGFPHTRHTWRTELAALDELGHRVVAPDQRGYSAGARPDGTDAYRVENLVADAFAIAAATAPDLAGSDSGGAGGGKFHVVGHDWGGQLGWIMAGLYPERIKTLSVISRPHPAGFIGAMKADPAQAERSKHHRSFQRPEATAEWLADDAARLRAILDDWGARHEDIEAYLATLGNHAALDAAINWYRAMGRSTPLPADVPAVAVPTLYVWGNADSSVGRVAAESTADFVTGPYRFVEVPGGSHCIPDQSPGLFTELLIEHIESAAG
ncbi:MAG: alpha/beta fold hydrolase [Acidimicrobiales bacterium]